MVYFVVQFGQRRYLWKEQVNEVNCISITYREHFIPHIANEDILHQHIPRCCVPILKPCEGCSKHTPYYRDLRPICVVVTATHQLYKIDVHGKSFKPKLNISNLPKNCVFPQRSLFSLRISAFNIFTINSRRAGSAAVPAIDINTTSANAPSASCSRTKHIISRYQSISNWRS
ncbi:uncharacterized protein OCT59_021312 [Rhizophagus irregularis]|uniref:Uncharacterized protein n=2 Tax=Rhizophagus irregularis TaxID=588596 RepID=U9SRX1_RHIID|nr:hypothetical protein GLOIN_2v1507785 [Rhizophagus irregularis DAOM 181602=DAOM 197198]EXX52791.1 hypothetical protein RirG_249940 [Rhizophagus irregularis DAOM 197198w]POG81422.1 hypothetical protein GLOIN_2v1507785 [Rhizophagus irregularis DAOM 181602=DAOM 197198]UZO02834.1 hypothetical protein OCT59_021312 [Rhizophagus irregularis]CAG8635516.1 13554_t:CDS:1 [Rhizophagus irregularis]|eukprot:XP_025188288.1 hypothetical protein GLOIN_2v1507785 [Rhizophagus irregularis DAOM 181602=DAOM 197198]